MCGQGEWHGRWHRGCRTGRFGPGMGYGAGPHGAFRCCCGMGAPGAAGGPGMHFRRRFATREERIARLEAYLKELQAEAKAVEERLAELKAAE